ncbi:MAG TPA: riboflavin synthase [Candidatus Hydrogenedentes bacterium]|nr:riboflavin synthase [Candidatus Hydrogenedentota bacterium]HOL78262.1 riboflavin synthase [Candidatus Hydrogenedentota bacterium]HPO85377.1 riboflavin synthase [Candidatus Hydrogenedentota bacterium]
MFTGIIEEIGVVSRRSGSDLAILAKTVLDRLQEGDSVAVNGVCLTVVAINDEGFVVQVSPETMECSTVGMLRPGDAVNLERALAFGDRIGGHLVQGHVDGIGRVESVRPQGQFSLWRFRTSSDIARYLVPKGSVAVDGISLTVVEPQGDTFAVAIIPATIERTTLRNKRPGDLVNIEADLIGKHLYHYLMRGKESGLTLDFLASHGFTKR